MTTVDIRAGDCLLRMKELADNSIDAVITDPPYGLSKQDQSDVSRCLAAWLSGKVYTHHKAGFMGNDWDAFVPGPEYWREVFRVLKPGGHAVVFAGTRTQDLMGIALRLAGFEMRETFMYMFGTGFPKSQDLAKAIDKSGGGDFKDAERQALAKAITSARSKAGVTRRALADLFPQYAAVTANWERLDVGFRVPSEDAYQVLVDKFKLPDGWRELVRAVDKRRKLKGQSADRRDDGSVYGLAHEGAEYTSTTDVAAKWKGFGSSVKPAYEPILCVRKPLEGTIVKNVLKHGTGALNIDGCRIETTENLNGGAYAKNPQEREQLWGADAGNSYKRGGAGDFVQPKGRFPANVILDEEAGKALDAQSGTSKSTGGRIGNKTGVGGDRVYAGGYKSQAVKGDPGFGDTGGASRFFYCAKANKHDRAGSKHPTVKPVSLMRWLCRLITPPGGTVLDPFAGSGSTGQAAKEEGFNCVLIEREPQYVADIESRMRVKRMDVQSTPVPAVRISTITAIKRIEARSRLPY